MCHSHTAPLTSSRQEGPNARQALQIHNHVSMMVRGMTLINTCLSGVYVLLLLDLELLRTLH